MITIIGLVMTAVLVLQGCTTIGTESTMSDSEDAMMDDEMKDEEMAEGSMKEEDAMDEDMMEKEDAMDEDMMEKEDVMEDDMMGHDDGMTDMMMNEGDMAPTFELKDLEGNVHSLEAYKGQKVYVKFWASWCSICLAGLDELDEFSAETEDFVVITIVSPDYNGEKSTESFTTWFESLGYDNIVVLLDEDGAVSQEYGVRGYPTSAYIGSDGVLVGTVPGHNTEDVVNANMEVIH